MDWLKQVHKTAQRKLDFGAGDDVRVWFRILELGKERLAHFEGVVVRVRGSGHSKTFTVRRITHGEGVERVFPLDGKILDRIEVLRRGKVNRARIYFLRGMAKRVRLADAGSPNSGAEDKSAEEASAAPAAV